MTAAGGALAAQDIASADASVRPLRRWRDEAWAEGDAAPPSPEEAAVAIVIDGSSQAVLMATPHDLHDFALGFALTEGLVASRNDVTGFESAAVQSPATLPSMSAYEARLWLKPGLSVALAERRRAMVGPVGCGLCGVDSIAAALPSIQTVAADLRFTPAQVLAAMDALAHGQVRWRDTPAIHGACLWTGTGALVREDVGRHNALDKLAGAAARAGLDGTTGIVAMTSRLSVDLVQKTARLGCGVLVGVGVPTGLAVAWADAAGITLIGRARGTSFDLFTHPERIGPDA